jgi:hypothetical protein
MARRASRDRSSCTTARTTTARCWRCSPAPKWRILARAAELLNDAVDWQELGFVCDGRFLFSQRSLQTCMLPDVFETLRSRKS